MRQVYQIYYGRWGDERKNKLVDWEIELSEHDHSQQCSKLPDFIHSIEENMVAIKTRFFPIINVREGIIGVNCYNNRITCFCILYPEKKWYWCPHKYFLSTLSENNLVTCPKCVHFFPTKCFWRLIFLFFIFGPPLPKFVLVGISEKSPHHYALLCFIMLVNIKLQFLRFDGGISLNFSGHYTET